VLDEEGERLVDLLVADEVVVVEDERERGVVVLEVVDERRHDVVHEARPGGAEERERERADLGVACPHGLDDVRPEPDGVIVGGVEREPRERPVRLRVGAPGGQERRLPPPRRGRDDR
jgi:hypothetical protein